MIASTASTTTVLVVLLVLIGFVMIGAAVWLVVATRRDAPALGPLEVMGERRFTRAAPEARVVTLDGARPPGALPPAPMVPFDEADAEPAAPGVPAVADAVAPVAGEVDEPGSATDATIDVVVGPDPEPEVEPEVDDVVRPEVTVLEPEVVAVGSDVDVEIDERVPAPESS